MKQDRLPQVNRFSDANKWLQSMEKRNKPRVITQKVTAAVGETLIALKKIAFPEDLHSFENTLE